MMNNDRKLIFAPPAPAPVPAIPVLNHVLLTGGTGFIGPFLIKSLLEQTRAKIYVLVQGIGRRARPAKIEGGDGIDGLVPCRADVDV